MSEEEKDKLRQAWNNLIDEIAKSLHLYQILDWLEEKLERWSNEHDRKSNQ